MNLQKPCDMSLTGMKVSGAPRRARETPLLQRSLNTKGVVFRFRPKQQVLPRTVLASLRVLVLPYVSLSLCFYVCVYVSVCVNDSVSVYVCVCVCVCVCTAHVCMQRVLFSLLKRMGLLWSGMGPGGGACDGG